MLYLASVQQPTFTSFQWEGYPSTPRFSSLRSIRLRRTLADLACHHLQVTAVTVHPLTDYFVTVSLDKTWTFYDGNEGRALAKVSIHPQD